MLKQRPHLEIRNLSLMVFFAVTLFDFHAKVGAEHRIDPPEFAVVPTDVDHVELNVFVLNAFLRPTPLSVGDENSCRAERIADHVASSVDLPDFVVFTEAFSEDAVGTMTKRLRTKFPYFNVRKPEREGIALTNGGLAIFSRFPIERWSTRTFDTCAGWLSGKGDCSASKGVLHALVKVRDDLKVNILATHLDAGSRPQDRDARASQFAQIQEFMGSIDDLQKWPTMFAGDFNVAGNEYQPSLSSEYKKMWASLGEPIDAYKFVRGTWSKTREHFEHLNTMNCRGGGLVGCRDMTTNENWSASSRLDYLFVYPTSEPHLANLDVVNSTHDTLRDNSCGTRYLSDHRAVMSRVRLGLHRPETR